MHAPLLRQAAAVYLPGVSLMLVVLRSPVLTPSVSYLTPRLCISWVARQAKVIWTRLQRLRLLRLDVLGLPTTTLTHGSSSWILHAANILEEPWSRPSVRTYQTESSPSNCNWPLGISLGLSRLSTPA